MISLCSSSSEFIECFWSISGPVSDRAISGLGQSLKLVWNLKEEKISYFITIEMNYAQQYAVNATVSPHELPQAKDVARITQNQENGRHIESQENNAPNRHEGGKLSPKRR